MKKSELLARALIAGAILCSSHAYAGDWYSAASFVASYAEIHDIDSVGTPLGPLNTDGRADEVVGIGLAIGLRGQSLPLRGELEYIWRYRTDMNFNQSLPDNRVNGFKNDARTQQVMANLYWDFLRKRRWSPYIGGGAGVVHHSVDSARSLDLTFNGGHITDTSTDISWALMLGVLRDDFFHGKLQIGYRFSDLGEMHTGRYPGGAQFEGGEYLSHEIVVGWQLDI